jgi:hypothetical protein
MDLQHLYANIDDYLLKAQSDLESAISAYDIACIEYAETTMKYRKKRSKVTQKLKDGSTPATIIPDIAKGKTAKSKMAMMKTEGKKKYMEKLIMAIEHRINNYKFIGRKTDNLAR